MLPRRDVLAGLAMVGVPWSTLRAQGRVVTIPVELTASRVVIACTIGGQGPYRFVLDTGGIVSLIQPGVARQLGLRQIGQRKLGMGGGQAMYPIYEARDVAFGGAARQDSVALAGTDIIDFGDGLTGSFAAGLLTASDAELDFDGSMLRLYPEGGSARDGWTRGTEAIEHKGLPAGSAYLFANVVLDGQTLRCGLDTGFPQAMRVTAKTARRYGWEGRNWAPGPGGMRFVRAGVLEMGGARFDRPIIAIQQPGAVGEVFGDGLIGLPLIRRFNLATEVKPNLLWMRRSGQPEAPVRYNMAGLWIDRAEGGAVIGAVGKGSPAEAAGLVVGDRIDGAFAAILPRLAGAAGSRVTLRTRRGDEARDVTLTLADYL